MKIHPSQEVMHAAHGKGVVLSVWSYSAKVRFPDGDYHCLLSELSLPPRGLPARRYCTHDDPYWLLYLLEYGTIYAQVPERHMTRFLELFAVVCGNEPARAGIQAQGMEEHWHYGLVITFPGPAPDGLIEELARYQNHGHVELRGYAPGVKITDAGNGRLSVWSNDFVWELLAAGIPFGPRRGIDSSPAVRYTGLVEAA